MFKVGDKAIVSSDGSIYSSFNVGTEVAVLFVYTHNVDASGINRHGMLSTQCLFIKDLIPINILPMGSGQLTFDMINDAWAKQLSNPSPSSVNTIYGLDVTSPPPYGPKCECGVDAIGGGKHSSYCPKVHIS